MQKNYSGKSKMNIKNPLVSILIPGFKPQWLDLCINSCLSQSYKNIEVLVGDDTQDGIISDIASKWSNLNVSIQLQPLNLYFCRLLTCWMYGVLVFHFVN